MALSIREIKDMQVVEPDWLIKGLLTRGNTMVMIGPPKRACKSWLMLAAAWDLAEGKPVWGIEQFSTPRPQTVVYFTQEDTAENAHDRIMGHVNSGREINNRLWIVPKNLLMTLDRGSEKILAELTGVLEKVGQVDLVVFDPLRRIIAGDENDSQVIASIWCHLDEIHKKFKCGTVLVHHVRKPPSDKSNYDPTDPFIGRGSSDIYGGGDAFATVQPVQKTQESGLVNIYFETKRASTPDPAAFSVDFKSAQVKHLGTPKKPLTKLSDFE